jgi:hypothetical protein
MREWLPRRELETIKYLSIWLCAPQKPPRNSATYLDAGSPPGISPSQENRRRSIPGSCASLFRRDQAAASSTALPAPPARQSSALK